MSEENEEETMTEQEWYARCILAIIDYYRNKSTNIPEDMTTEYEDILLNELSTTSDELNFANEYIDRLRLWIGEVEWTDFFDANADFFNDEEE